MQLKLEYSEVWVWAMSVGVNYDKDSMWKFHFQMNTHVIVSGPFNDKPRISYVYLQDNVIILYCLFFMISVICAIKHLDFQLRARVLGLWRRLAGVPLNHFPVVFRSSSVLNAFPQFARSYLYFFLERKKKECISNYPMWLSHNCHHELTARKPYLSGLAACDADWMLAAQTYSQTPTNIFLNFLTMVLSHTCSDERCLRYRFERQIFTCRPWSLTCFIRDSGE